MSMTYKEREDYGKALDKVYSMSVTKFQKECQKNLIDNHLNNYIFDLAKILMRSSSNDR